MRRDFRRVFARDICPGCLRVCCRKRGDICCLRTREGPLTEAIIPPSDRDCISKHFASPSRSLGTLFAAERRATFAFLPPARGTNARRESEAGIRACNIQQKLQQTRPLYDLAGSNIRRPSRCGIPGAWGGVGAFARLAPASPFGRRKVFSGDREEIWSREERKYQSIK